MQFLKSTVMGLGSAFTMGSVGGLPFSLESTEPAYDAGLPDFILLRGKAKADGSSVAVFKSKQPSNALAQNALRRIKTLRHPNVLAYIDGIDVPNNGHVFIVTEDVVPLNAYLDDIRAEYGANSNEEKVLIAWGLRSILGALKFINNDVKLIHGRLNPTSIFVTKGGEWKLGGFELTGEPSMSAPFVQHDHTVDPRFKAPECARRDWSSVASSPTYAVDMYALACLIIYLHHPSFSSPSDCSRVPSGLSTFVKRSTDATASRRLNPDQALTSAYFESHFLRQMTFLDELAIKSPDEKVEFYKDLSASIDALPKHTAVFKVLPALKAIVDFGVATGGKAGGNYKLDPSESHMLPAMVKIGSQLSPDEFKDQVLPTLIKLFGCNDRAVRLQLLQMMESFAVHFDAKLVNSNVIFDNICTGFHDTSAVLREYTVKSMLHIADKLSDANLNTKLMKFFAKLQTDPEPAIRTNTTICLGKIAPHLSAATRAKVLLPAFTRALKDPFPHARLAGLRTLVACDEYFTYQDVACAIIPAIAPLMLDISPSVRDETLTCMADYIKKIQDEAAQMKVREADEERERQLHEAANPAVIDAAPVSTTSSASWQPPKPAAPISANDFNDDGDDAWGDDLDDLTSPTTTTPATSTSSTTASWSTPAPSTFSSSAWQASLAPKPVHVTPPKPLQPAASKDDFFGDWGAPSSTGSSASRTGSGSLSLQKPSAPTGFSGASASLVKPAEPKKSLQERRSEAKAKREPLGALKLQNKPKGGDNWDWDM
ncbi:SCY1 protein kinase [Saprolegnia parasitica CBS 223.65]|uniref:SCY1 protein kinase n=1 Tax=Saprolegnia parasitica (strain CBS 223.65) TaxID=695850 RepID=A0A067CHP2_SAPPC|nr:SCY1 protein kinase [Saprolegnia parasitica CBS 223.65]KDO30043.1 SCY1 protein kinase [Saprolegnia parasitica CBS 223.65]|eukprot:XP_012199224.1 SCY1 protein kinase [Saprolegnia parasitica CBS 223.65]